MKRVLIIFIIVVLNSCDKAPKDWKITHKSDYSISYPKDWKVKKSPPLGIDFAVSAPLKSKDQIYPTHVVLLVKDASKGLNIDAIATMEIDKIQNRLSGKNALKKEKIEHASQVYYKITYSGVARGFHFNYVENVWLKNNKIYITRFTCNSDDYDKDIIIGEKILNTFDLK